MPKRRERVVRAFATTSVVLPLLLAALAVDVAAQQKPGPAFGSEAGEVALGVASVASLGAVFLPQREGAWRPSHEDHFDPWTSGASDVTGAYLGVLLQLTAGAGLETAYLAAHREPRPGVGALRTLAVESESAALTGGLTYAIKRVAGRCRPRASRGGNCHGREFDAFPSGHTSPLGAIASARLVSAARSDGTDDYVAVRWTSFVLAETTMVTTGILRVVSASHSWEDVVAGGLLGHLTGVFVALAHPEVSLSPRTASSAAALRRSRPDRTQGRGAARAPDVAGAATAVAPPIAISWATSF